MAFVHGRLATTALLYIGILALWGFWRYYRKQGPDSNYFGALAIGEILMLIQGALGAYLYFSGQRPAQSLHLLYGIVSVLVVPAVYAFTRGNEDRRDSLVYGAALLFMVGILLRAVQTGGGL